MEVWQFGIGLGVSAVLACIRYRFPSIPMRLASAGIGAGLGLTALSLAWPGWPLGLSFIINVALAAALIDYWLSGKARSVASPASTSDGQESDIRPPRRRLTDQEKSAITRHAIAYEETGDAPKQLQIFRNTASRDAIWCATDLAEAFQQANWNIQEGGSSGAPVFPRSGIGLAFYNYGNLAPDQRTVKEALEAAGIEYDIISPEDFIMARTTIFVTDPH